MNDYAQLIKSLRSSCLKDDIEDCIACEMLQDEAADAIEGLLAEREEIKEKWKNAMYIVKLATDIVEKNKQKE